MANKNSHKKTKPKSHKLKPQALINNSVLELKAPSPSRNVPPNSNSPLDGSSVEHKNPSLDGSLEANCAKVKALSSVEHLINPLDGSLDGDCSEDGEFEEEQLDFSCSEEEYATSPPPPSSPAPAILEPPFSPAPVVLEPPVPISYTSTPSRSVKPGNPSVPPPVNGKWRDLFSTNRNIFSSPKLTHFSALHDISSCPFLIEDLDHSCDDWKLCAIGYVSGKFPGYRALNSIIENVWKCAATLSMHESGWLVYKFQSEEDKWSVLGKGPYLVYGRPLILRSMSEYFNFSSSEMSQVPVWIQFPYLPLKCWTPLCLSKLASVLGKPLQCDKFTATKERISCAWVLVEVDLLADLRSSINVSLPNGNSFIQKVIYETLPKFCKHCKVLGHSTGTCSKGKEEVKKFVKAGPGATKSNDKDKGNDSTHNLAAATWTIGVTNVDKAASSSAAPKGKDKDSRNDSTHLHLAAATCSNEELPAAATCSNKELLAAAACSNETAVPACAATKANVKVKEMVSTCLNLVDEALVDIPSVVAPTVQVPSVAPSPVDISKPVVPTHPPTSCATHLSPVDASEPMAPTHPPASSADKNGQLCS